MLRLLVDENFNGDAGIADPDILALAAVNDRIILTHDRATLPDYAFERLGAGESVAGFSS
jgi:predicted nuclease of predicted toxin-antitoxin system